MSTQNRNLHQAKRKKNDEFYTLLSDIEGEMSHYKACFKGKVVYCNCDDPERSNFWKYFFLNFEFLGLKKLIATHYEKGKPSYSLSTIDGTDVVKSSLKQNGDFRSPECVELLEECDIVVTNPPFSLFREYVAQLIEYKKDFIILGSMNAITYIEIFPFLQSNEMWLEYNTSLTFLQPDGSEKSLRNTCWYTNIKQVRPNGDIVLSKTYNDADYPKYDNCDAINVSRVKDIPVAYDGVMGVPITFITKWNPEQFEILGIANDVRWIGYECRTIIDGKHLYNRILIRNKRL